MKHSQAAIDLHSNIDWSDLQDLRLINPVGVRAVEVLRGVSVVRLGDFVSPKVVHEIIWIQVGKKFASTPSNISSALKKFDGRVDRQLTSGGLKFRIRPSDARVGVIHSGESQFQVDPKLVAICEQFHRAVSHLVRRRRGKKSILFSDEYDVQDVFGTVLKCLFDDVQDEEYTPSYAGGCTRIDFVIVGSETAVELKRARSTQKLADELIIDIERYAAHPVVRKLVCFIYDPDGLLRRDAAQIERDLSGPREHKGKRLEVAVLIRPK